MTVLDLSLIAIGLSADAFAVAIILGLSAPGSKLKHAIVVGLYFGVFQAGMPIIGYVAAIQFSGLFDTYGHWVASAVLCIIGFKMIKDCFCNDKCETLAEDTLKPSKLLPLAVATSIDALVVGASLAFVRVNIFLAIGLIGISTFVLSVLGFKIGKVFGSKLQSKANLVGGIILILIGIRVLFA